MTATSPTSKPIMSTGILRYLSVVLLGTLGCVGQTITYPTGNPAITGWTGTTFTATSWPAGTTMAKWYVDAYPAINPSAHDLGQAAQIGALDADGETNTYPFSWDWDSFWSWPGNHTVKVEAYDGLGNLLGTSATATFTNPNPWPVTCTPVMSVSAPASPWSGQESVTVTMGGCAGDSFSFYAYLDGIPQSPSAVVTGTSPQTISIDTTHVLDSPNHIVAVVAYDQNSAHYQIFTGMGTNIQVLSNAGEWNETVTITNGPTVPVEVFAPHDLAPISPAAARRHSRPCSRTRTGARYPHRRSISTITRHRSRRFRPPAERA